MAASMRAFCAWIVFSRAANSSTIVFFARLAAATAACAAVKARDISSGKLVIASSRARRASSSANFDVRVRSSLSVRSCAASLATLRAASRSAESCCRRFRKPVVGSGPSFLRSTNCVSSETSPSAALDASTRSDASRKTSDAPAIAPICDCRDSASISFD